MCFSCACLAPSDRHDDLRTIDTYVLQAAADQAGTDLGGVVSNIVQCFAKTVSGAVKAEAEAVPTDMATCRVVKAAAERRFTLGVAYPAMKADVSRAADGYRDFVSTEVLEKTAWDWLVKYRDVNLFHQGKTEGHFTPTESYIWRGPDWEIESPVDGKPYVVKSGDWMLGGIWDEYGWQLVKAGLVRGWSPEGGARRSTPDADRLAQLRS